MIMDEKKIEGIMIIGNVDAYRDAIRQFKEQVIELVRSGSMSEQTANKIILEQEYSFFQQLVTLEYNNQQE